MVSFAPTSAETLEDQRRYLEGHLVEVACLDCLARVRVRKQSEFHTSIQWDDGGGRALRGVRADGQRAPATGAVHACVPPAAGTASTAAVRDGRLAIGSRRWTEPLELTVVDVVEETGDARSIVFEAPTRPSRSPTSPGQFLTVAVPERPDRRGRPLLLPVAARRTRPTRSKITVKRTVDGYASNWICDNVRPGDTLHGAAAERDLHPGRPRRRPAAVRRRAAASRRSCRSSSRRWRRAAARSCSSTPTATRAR